LICGILLYINNCTYIITPQHHAILDKSIRDMLSLFYDIKGKEPNTSQSLAAEGSWWDLIWYPWIPMSGG